MRKSFKRGEVLVVDGKAWTPIRQTANMPPSPDWIEAVTPNYLPELPQAIEGPPGPPGEASTVPGPAGADGLPGETFNPRGEWKRKSEYKRLDVIRHDDASYVCTSAETSKEPGSSKSGWVLLCRDGERGADGEAIVYAAKGRPGRDGRDAVLDTPAIADSPMQVGDVVYVSGDARVDRALANNVDTATAVGIITSVNSSAVSYRTTGVVENAAWNLVPKQVYYLDPFTPGGMTTTYPETAGHFVVILGVAASETQLVLSVHYMVEQS